METRFVDLFEQTEGLPLVWVSGQNIDRIVTVYRACKQTGRQLIIDMYTAHILKATGNDRIPHAEWDGVKVFLPKSQKAQILRNQAFDVSDGYRPWRIYPEHLAGEASKSVMLFRPSMAKDLEDAGCLAHACVICSVWQGYLEQEENRWFHQWMERHSLPLHHCHTSGHASTEELRQLRDAFGDAVVVPIHLQDPARFQGLFNGVEIHHDGEWWAVR